MAILKIYILITSDITISSDKNIHLQNHTLTLKKPVYKKADKTTSIVIDNGKIISNTNSDVDSFAIYLNSYTSFTLKSVNFESDTGIISVKDNEDNITIALEDNSRIKSRGHFGIASNSTLSDNIFISIDHSEM